MTEHLHYDVRDGVATITLDRPERKNAFTMEMVDAWADRIAEARRDSAVGALVLTGAGAAFCAGGDLDVIDADTDSALAAKRALSEHIHRVAFAMEEFDKPSIAAINGVAVGAGLDMALMCDLRFMSRSARVCEGYIRLGLVPGDGGAYYLPRIVGVAKALEMLWTGDFVDAEEALRIGLASAVYDDDELAVATHAFAAKLAAGPAIATRMIKRAVYQGLRTDLRTSLDLISSHMGVVGTSEESRRYQEALRARIRTSQGARS